MDYRRNWQPGGTFFFAVVAYHRHRLFADPAAFDLLQTVLHEAKTERPLRMEARVVLPDHLHMMWALPPGDGDFSWRWAKIKSQFTRRWLAAGATEARVTPGQGRKQARGIWQPRFFEHTIRDQDDFVAHVEYIHYNPVKHGYVEYLKDWARSSFRAFVRRGLQPLNWCCGVGKEDSRPRIGLLYDGFE